MTLHFELTDTTPTDPEIHPELGGRIYTGVDPDELIVAVLTDVEPAQKLILNPPDRAQPGWDESIEWEYRIAATYAPVELDGVLTQAAKKAIEVALTRLLSELREDAGLDAAMNRLGL
jgi:hypothetical protein